MAVFLMLPLFGKPGQELNEGGDVTPKELRELAEDLRERLTEAADIVEKLTGAGWEAQMGLYDIHLSHPYIGTAAHAEERLESLGIDPEKVFIEELEDEEQEEGEWEGEEEAGSG